MPRPEDNRELALAVGPRLGAGLPEVWMVADVGWGVQKAMGGRWVAVAALGE